MCIWNERTGQNLLSKKKIWWSFTSMYPLCLHAMPFLWLSLRIFSPVPPPCSLHFWNQCSAGSLLPWYPLGFGDYFWSMLIKIYFATLYHYTLCICPFQGMVVLRVMMQRVSLLGSACLCQAERLSMTHKGGPVSGHAKLGLEKGACIPSPFIKTVKLWPASQP